MNEKQSFIYVQWFIPCKTVETLVAFLFLTHLGKDCMYIGAGSRKDLGTVATFV
jgi:hypothetical protein